MPRWGSVLVMLLAVLSLTNAQSPRLEELDETPQTLEAFQQAVARVLQETRVPGAGIALVHADHVEWAGGVGLADRDRGTPVTADTHFRLGSISKTFVAMALIQLAERDELDLEAPVGDLIPDVPIENPWDATDPVRVLHLLEHTAGFDDMHFNEIYNLTEPPGLPMLDVLMRNRRSRVARWRPGTRMSYSNPGYAVAGFIIEQVAGEPYEDYIQREILEPLGMYTSSFRLSGADERGQLVSVDAGGRSTVEPMLARGYTGPEGPPTPFWPIHLRPAGNFHSSPREMARFVQMLLNWGELGDAFVIDPEYLGTMQYPRTSLAARAGLRSGYGAGIFATLTLPYPVLGHDGGIDGFVSTYAYSPARDVGYVIALNSTGSGADDAITRLSSLAIRYLKRDVAPPNPPAAAVAAETLVRYEGYYHDLNPRNQIFWPVAFLATGRTVARTGQTLEISPVIGAAWRLIPVTERTFRREEEVDASVIFTTDEDGRSVMAGLQLYAALQPRWRIELVRLPVVASLLVALTPLLVAVAWVARIGRAQPRGFWGLKLAILGLPLLLIAPLGALALTGLQGWGALNAATVIVFLATLMLPLLAAIVALLATRAARHGASRLVTTYAWGVATAVAVLSIYLWSHGLIALRLWSY